MRCRLRLPEDLGSPRLLTELAEAVKTCLRMAAGYYGRVKKKGSY